jgi:hypothetical protein
MMAMTGGMLSVEKEPVKAADAMRAHIETNRKKRASKPRYFIYVTALYKNSGVIR